MKDIALKYLNNNKSVFPVGKDKKPLIAWEAYQNRLATAEEVEKWWTMYPNANIGIVTGKISNITVVDFDLGSEDYKNFPETLTVRSGSGGFHLYYEYYPIRNKTGILPHIDIRGDGGYIVAYPSETEDKIENGKLIKKGGKYELIKEIGFAKFPSDKFEENIISKERKNLPDLIQVSAGSRNDSMASLIGGLILTAKSDEWDKKVWPMVTAINQTYLPPLSENELQGIYYSICSAELTKKESQNIEHSKKFSPKLWAIGDILKQDFGEEEWLVESLISKQGMTVLSGSPGDFKTWVTIHIAMCIARNTPVFGKFPVKQGAVLVIDEEDHIRLLKKRLELLGAKDTDDIYYLSQNGIKVDDEAIRDYILNIVKEKNIKLLILDSLVRIHQQDENDAKGMAKVFSGLQKIIVAGASILFTHHHRKQIGMGGNNPGDRMRGSSDILAVVDCHITIEKKKEEENKLIIRQTKLRQAELLKPFEINITQGDLGPSGFEYAGGHDEKKKKSDEASEAVILLLEDGMKSRPEIQAELIEEFGKEAIDNGIKIAESADAIERVPKEEVPKENSRKAYYRIKKDGGSDEDGNLPISQSYIDSRKQEDDKRFESLPEQIKETDDT